MGKRQQKSKENEKKKRQEKARGIKALKGREETSQAELFPDPKENILSEIRGILIPVL